MFDALKKFKIYGRTLASRAPVAALGVAGLAGGCTLAPGDYYPATNTGGGYYQTYQPAYPAYVPSPLEGTPFYSGPAVIYGGGFGGHDRGRDWDRRDHGEWRGGRPELREPFRGGAERPEFRGGGFGREGLHRR